MENSQALAQILLAPGYGEVSEKRSRFLASALPVHSQDDVAQALSEARAAHREARHVVHAFRLRHDNLSRFSDDSEPSGTAGAPLFHLLDKQGLYDALLIVVRYFGGVLLGTGGLTRAYGAAGAAALADAKIGVLRHCVVAAVDCPYPQYDSVCHLLSSCGATIKDSDFAEEITITFVVGHEEYGALCTGLSALLRTDTPARVIEQGLMVR